MGKRGPKSKCNDALAQQAAEYLRQGHYRATVARLIGITPECFSDWMHKTGSPYAEFQTVVHQAEAEAEHLQLAKITESPEPADAKWYLSRKFPDRWAETRRVDVSGRIDYGMKLNADALTSDTAREHVLGLAEWLFSDAGEEVTDPAAGDNQPHGAGKGRE